VLPILAIVQCGKARQAPAGEGQRKHKKLAKTFNIAAYGVCAIVLAIVLPLTLGGDSTAEGGSPAKTAAAQNPSPTETDSPPTASPTETDSPPTATPTETGPGMYAAPDDGQVTAGLPITIAAHGNSYTISSFSTGVDDNGNTTITAQGSGFDVLPIRNGKMMIPVYCSFATASGEEYEMEGINVTSSQIIFNFGTSETPVTVSFYPEDNRDDKHTFDVE